MGDFKNEATKNLEDLIEKFNKEQVSALVGAGFSKNASKSFPLWNDLLNNMVKELFQDEIKKGLKGVYRKRKNIEEKLISNIIEREGFLTIPQIYIDRKGKRESLTIYIEDFFRDIDTDTENELTVHKSFLLLPWVDICTTNYDTLLEQTENQISKKWDVVTSAKHLKRGNRDRIVKIHGCLSESQNKKIDFDDFSEHRYIITRNDFESYKEVHSGFTSFMKVKILQDSLCLFGFSGNDPNFLYWVNWLRKTMSKGGTYSEPNPIFLIDNSPNPDIDNETRLFYENNYIKWIPIKVLHNKMSSIINKHVFDEKKKLVFKENDRKDLLLLLFEYLSQNIKKWPGYSQEINETHLDERVKLEKIMQLSSSYTSISEISDMVFKTFPERKQLNVPSLFAYEYSSIIQSHFKVFLETPTPNIKIFRLITFVMYNNLLLLTNVFDIEMLKKLMEAFDKINPEKLLEKDVLDWIDFKLLYLKNLRFVSDKKVFLEHKEYLNKILENYGTDDKEILNSKNSLYYEEGLLYLNLQEEEELESLLIKWTPEKQKENNIFWLVKKAFLLTSLQKRTSQGFELLKIAEKIKSKPEERLWFLEIYQHYQFAFDLKRVNRIDAEVNSLKNRGFSSLESMSRHLLKIEDNFLNRRTTIEPPENIRYSGNTQTIGGLTPDKKIFWDTFRFLRLIEETGISLKIENTLWGGLSDKRWLHCFMTLYQSYPNQVLSYSMRFFDNSSDESFSTRIIQLITFSDYYTQSNMESFFHDFEKIFWYRFENNIQIRHLMFILTEIMRALPYDKWSSFVEKLWSYIEKNTENNINFWFYRGRVWGWLPCFAKIIPLIEDKNLFSQIVSFLLKSNISDDTDKSEMIRYFILLSSNKYFVSVIKEFSKAKVFIADCLENVNNHGASTVKSFYYLLDDDLQKRIRQEIKGNKKEYGIDVISRFNNDEYFLSQLYPILYDVINNFPIKQLPSPLELDILRFFSSQKKWKEEEKKKLYDLFYKIWNEKILDFLKTGIDSDTGEDYQKDSKLETVHWIYKYLIYEREYLNINIPDYDSFFNEVCEIYYRLKGFSEWSEQIYTNNEVDFKLLSNSIIDEIRFSDNVILLDAWDIILNRILLQESPHYESVFERIAYFLWDRKEKKNHRIFKSEKLYLLILQKYLNGIPQNMDRIFMEQQLSLIAESLQFIGIKDEVIDFWLEKKKNSRYKEVREFNSSIIDMV